MKRLIILMALCTVSAAFGTDSLESVWANPPTSARLRAYWWWLNGQVTKAAITRDLEEMKAKGFGGALICDAGGAEQDGNDKVPPGPAFMSPEWRELFKHTLHEADRLGLEMSLNMQSGWNLGGPMVTADDAAKKLVWSEAQVNGGAKVELQLPLPKTRDGYYRDAFVVAYPLGANAPTEIFAGLTASSEATGHTTREAGDGKEATFWVSSSNQPGDGPTREKPEWLQFNFLQPVSANGLTVTPRPGYGPREAEVQASDDGKTFRTLKSFTGEEKKETAIQFEATKAKFFRLLILGCYDPRFPKTPRNVQIAEVKLTGQEGNWPTATKGRATLEHWEEKALHKPLHFSAPDSTPLLEDLPATAGEEETHTAEVIDLTSKLGPDGILRWTAPAGNWAVLRFGCTIGDHSKVSTSSDTWKGYAVDVMDAGAFQRYWDAVIEPLLADAGPLAGRVLKYLHTDSWEVEPVNWTPTLREEFRKRRGYDFLPYLPALAGRIVDSRPTSNRFLHDFRKTVAELAIDNHYRLFRDGAHKHGMQIHPESGGPHAVPIDAQRCLGWDDAPMSEFWAWSWRHRIGDTNRFFVKQPASAAHTYGHKLVLAEGFTTIGPHWQETVWDNLKPSFDRACCEGLNLLVWHAFVCSPLEQGVPGIQYFAGTHFNPNSTWWAKSGPFLAYINRSQALLQQGLFVADACYYYGDHAPNFAQIKRKDPARVMPGYDYDVVTEEAILTRMSVRDGRIVLPDGMSYRILVLRDAKGISLAVLRKVRELVEAGATVVGPRPEFATGLAGYPQSDRETEQLATLLWAKCDGKSVTENRVGKGRIVWGKTAREVLQADGIGPDFAFKSTDGELPFDYIHRRADNADIYFISSQTNVETKADFTFRVTGKQPELWDPVSGETRPLPRFEQTQAGVTVALQFTPYGSMFIVFRQPALAKNGAANFAECQKLREITGAWTVQFDPKWGGPSTANFEKLTDWTQRPEPGIKYYSGTATYRKTFEVSAAELAQAKGKILLDLGTVKELAEVTLNGKKLGIAWSKPFRVDATSALKPGANQLEIEVVNFWPNRIIGDDALPPEKRLTRTNIRKLTKDIPLMESGLLGPVQILHAAP